jgi:RNA polymerase sigma-70 factor (ECF subfamily)
VQPDVELSAALARNESWALADLYRQYRARLHQYALSLIRSRTEAEDVVHDVFIGLARQASGGRVPRELSAYLYVSVRNRCVDRMRRKRELPLDAAELDLIVAPQGDEERINLQRVFNRALLALPTEQAEVVVLRTWHDLDFAAIAKMQGTSVNTALSRYQYGLSKLRKELVPHGR